MEKLEHEFVPYQAIEDFPRIEKELFEKGAVNYCSVCLFMALVLPPNLIY
jgi:hypothetical protein